MIRLYETTTQISPRRGNEHIAQGIALGYVLVGICRLGDDGQGDTLKTATERKSCELLPSARMAAVC